MPDDLDDVAGPDDLDDLDDDGLESLDEVVADDLGEEDLVADLETDDDLVEADVDLVEEVVDVEAVAVLAAPVAAPAATEEGEEEDEEEPEDEDVEASLDVILKERLVVEDEVDDEELTDVEDRTEMTERVLPKQPDEFVCRSCFLVKHPSQLADKTKMLCRDCV
ncbi:MAG TPA: DUF4193 family protein [Acidimicrobiales bacterium]|nr:DUF4193 family protein [Acidimicrobiales bacterium]